MSDPTSSSQPLPPLTAEEIEKLTDVAGNPRLTKGPWFIVYEPEGDEDAGVTDYGPSGQFVAGDPASSNYVSFIGEANAKFVETFDPPTVLRLLSALAEMERFAGGWQKAVYTILTIAGLSPAQYSADEAAAAMQAALAERDRRIAEMERALRDVQGAHSITCVMLTEEQSARVDAESRATAAEAREAALRTLLKSAQQFVHDACDDEDPEASRGASELLAEIDAALSSPAPSGGEADQ